MINRLAETPSDQMRDSYQNEMRTGQDLTPDNSYKFELAPWKSRFNGMRVLFLVCALQTNVRVPRITRANFGSKVYEEGQPNVDLGNIHPMGAGALTTILKIAGCDVKLLDLSAEQMGPDDVLEVIEEFQPRFIAMSCWSPTAKSTFELTDIIKTKFKDLPIVVGGPHITAFPELTLKMKESIDIVAVGEGEPIILELAEYFHTGIIPLEDIKGIGYRKNGKLIIAPSRPRISNLDDLPYTDRSHFKKDAYAPMPSRYKRLPYFNLVTSRGCPYKCTFCFEAGRFGLKFRSQSPQRVVDEIKYLQKEFGAQEIHFWDDIFLVNKKWIFEFCNLLEKENIDITWTCESRVDHVTPELLNRIAKAGCHSIFYGFESGVDKLLADMKKGVTVEQNRRAAEWTAKAGIGIRASFILGLPQETPEDGQKTIDFALSLPNLDSLFISFAAPHPGTELYDDVKDEIKMDEHEYIDELTKYTQFEVTYIAPAYKGQEHLLYEMRARTYRKFYFSFKFIWRQFKSIKSFSDIVRYYHAVKLALGMAF